MVATPSKDQAEVILVGCGCPLRGSKCTISDDFFLSSYLVHLIQLFSTNIIVGWYHAVQMLGGECPSAKLCHIVEPWFLGAGATGSYLL